MRFKSFEIRKPTLLGEPSTKDYYKYNFDLVKWNDDKEYCWSMERDNIIKALECCHSHSHKNCPECPYNKDTEKACFMLLMEHSLALITSQEQRIKELTEQVEWRKNQYLSLVESHNRTCDYLNTKEVEMAKLTTENEAISERYVIQVVTAIELDKQVQRLTEENERLKATKYMAYSDGRIEMLPTIQSAKSDTVREMQKRLEAVAYQSSDWSHGGHPRVVELDDIDQIAKEMLEGEQ